MTTRGLALVPEPPDERPAGDVLIDAKGVQTLFPPDAVTLWWVRRNFAPDYRIFMNRRVFWWKSDALRWINSCKGTV